MCDCLYMNKCSSTSSMYVFISFVRLDVLMCFCICIDVCGVLAYEPQEGVPHWGSETYTQTYTQLLEHVFPSFVLVLCFLCPCRLCLCHLRFGFLVSVPFDFISCLLLSLLYSIATRIMPDCTLNHANGSDILFVAWISLYMFHRNHSAACMLHDVLGWLLQDIVPDMLFYGCLRLAHSAQ